MGMCALGDIFQAKVEELLGDTKGVKTYIDNILTLSKYSFKKHIEQSGSSPRWEILTSGYQHYP